jgi:hypothetical protein
MRHRTYKIEWYRAGYQSRRSLLLAEKSAANGRMAIAEMPLSAGSLGR